MAETSMKAVNPHPKANDGRGPAGNHARRLQRLQEILDELVALTDWKKVGTRLQEAACLLVIP